MAAEAEIILTFIFKRSGKQMLKESEIYLPLSIELGWFTTKEATTFVKQAIEQDRLIEKKVPELNGFKGLYSDSYYTEEEFWQLHDRALYQDLKTQYDPNAKFQDLFAKTVKRA